MKTSVWITRAAICAIVALGLGGCAALNTAQRAANGLIGGTAKAANTTVKTANTAVNSTAKALLPAAQEADRFRIARDQARQQRAAEKEAEKEQKRFLRRMKVTENYAGTKKSTWKRTNSKLPRHQVIDATPPVDKAQEKERRRLLKEQKKQEKEQRKQDAEARRQERQPTHNFLR